MARDRLGQPAYEIFSILAV